MTLADQPPDIDLHDPASFLVEPESRRHLEIAASADTAEAFRAFVEKRAPRSTTR